MTGVFFVRPRETSKLRVSLQIAPTARVISWGGDTGLSTVARARSKRPHIDVTPKTIMKVTAAEAQQSTSAADVHARNAELERGARGIKENNFTQIVAEIAGVKNARVGTAGNHMILALQLRWQVRLRHEVAYIMYIIEKVETDETGGDQVGAVQDKCYPLSWFSRRDLDRPPIFPTSSSVPLLVFHPLFVLLPFPLSPASRPGLSSPPHSVLPSISVLLPRS